MKYRFSVFIFILYGLWLSVVPGLAADEWVPLPLQTTGEPLPSPKPAPNRTAAARAATPLPGSELVLKLDRRLASLKKVILAAPAKPQPAPSQEVGSVPPVGVGGSSPQLRLPLPAVQEGDTRPTVVPEGLLPGSFEELFYALVVVLLLLSGLGLYVFIKRRKKPWSAKHTAECNLCCLPTSVVPLVGRQAVLRQLDSFLADPDVAVVNCVAAAGVGKTALIEGWMYQMRPHFGGAHKVFAWTFQHTSIVHLHAVGGGPSSSGLFFTQALRFFGHEGELPDTEEKRAIRLSELLYRQPSLLILDGVDPLLHEEGARTTRLADGFQDQGLYQLVRRMCHPPLEQKHANSLVVLTSRDLTYGLGEAFDAPPGARNSYREILLEDLTVKEGVQLLKKLGVGKSFSRRLPVIVRNLHGHALSLLLLGGVLTQRRPEWQPTPDEVDHLTTPGEYGKHFYRLLHHYDKHIWPRESLHGIFLRLFGLFDRSMREEEWQVVREQVGFAQPLRVAGLESCAAMINDLEQAGFVLPYSERCGWQLHPLVRDYFTEKLESEFVADTSAGADAENRLQQAHGVLFGYFQNVLDDHESMPDNRAALEPLYRAVQHGCRAGRYGEALHSVYVRRIRRGTDCYSLAKLGAYSSELAALAGFFPDGWDRPPVVADLAPGDRAWLLAEAAFCLTVLGRVEEALGPQEEGMLLEMQRGAAEGAARAAVALCDLQMATGRLRAALDTADKGKAWAERHHLPVLHWVLVTKRAVVLQRLGQWSESLAEFEEAEAVPIQITPDDMLFMGIVEKAHVEFLLERQGAELEVLLQRAERAQEQAEYSNKPFWITLSLLCKCRVLMEMGQGSQVITPLFKAAVATADSEGETPLLAEILLQRATALYQQGERHAAQRDLATVLEIARRWGLPLLEVDGRILEGEMLLDEQRYKEVEARLLRVEELVAETEYDQHRGAVRALRSRWMESATTASR
ncbi:MAG: hypothetical protein HQL90_14680 [Magnetococcales bacterium]|nr:hypothetical protein [Magnetococcales bacterium]